jgi:hypothetical protein
MLRFVSDSEERVSRGLLVPTSRRLIWAAGIVLIVVGIVCLVLSGAVFTGWWQGTLDAFGVGLIVGGIVDVLAISLMNQILGGPTWGRRDINRQAEWIVAWPVDHPQTRELASSLLEANANEIDPLLREKLQQIVDGRAADRLKQRQRRVLVRRIQHRRGWWSWLW